MRLEHTFVAHHPLVIFVPSNSRGSTKNSKKGNPKVWEWAGNWWCKSGAWRTFSAVLTFSRTRNHSCCMSDASYLLSALITWSSMSSHWWKIHNMLEFLSSSSLNIFPPCPTNDTINSDNSWSRSVVSIPPLRSGDNATVAWFLMSALCITTNSISDKWNRKPLNFLVAAATLMIHFNTSWSVWMVKLWPSRYGCTTRVDQPTVKHSRSVVSKFCFVVVSNLDQLLSAFSSCLASLAASHNLFFCHSRPYQGFYVTCSMVRLVLVLIPACPAVSLTHRSPLAWWCRTSAACPFLINNSWSSYAGNAWDKHPVYLAQLEERFQRSCVTWWFKNAR